MKKLHSKLNDSIWSELNECCPRERGYQFSILSMPYDSTRFSFVSMILICFAVKLTQECECITHPYRVHTIPYSVHPSSVPYINENGDGDAPTLTTTYVCVSAVLWIECISIHAMYMATTFRTFEQFDCGLRRLDQQTKPWNDRLRTLGKRMQWPK